ncbi:MAG: LLM class F420-dependent oxidoreductase [Alphaproteobacteria bacterium]|nr:LLM class F420-dependent oxidoreductase [Alphaproteobacteria bacterium]MDP6590009.1 LLM class F420-dependent oxidoreductase [Alphaproteobacteria bacterium]
MEFGFNVPNAGPLARPAAIKQLVERGEALGFTILAIPDHIIIPRKFRPVYPYTDTGETDSFDSGEVLEPLALMASLAVMTRKARLLTSVLVLPYREPVLTAKIFATIDVMSGGRAIAGCGTGWMEEEFTAVGAPPFAERGKVTDEYIAAFRTMWTSEEPSFAGEYTNFSDIYFRPQPVQKPHIPIWIGGDSMAALRRTARVGDAWYPVGLSPKYPLNTVPRYAARAEILRRLTAEAGRDPEAVELSFWAVWYHEGGPVTVDDGSRHILLGSSEQTAEDIARMAEIGVSSMVFNFLRPTLAQSLEAMERFAAEVMPKAGMAP